MAQPYQSGLGEPQETAIARAVVERISLLHRDRGRYLKYVGQLDAMPSRMSDELFAGLLQTVRGQVPCALVAIDSSQAEPGGMTGDREQWTRRFEIAVGIYSSHRRGRVEGRLDPDAISNADDRKDPGLRAICEHVDVLLMGWPLGLKTVYELEPGQGGTLFTDRGGTLRELRYSVRVDRSREPWPEYDDFLEGIDSVFGIGDLEVHEMETEI